MHAYNLLGNRIKVYALRQMGLLSQTELELIERFTKMIVLVLTFGNPKRAVMQSLGNSPTVPVRKKEFSTSAKGSFYCRNRKVMDTDLNLTNFDRFRCCTILIWISQ